jgi:predicted RNA-binding protein YlxR (DUF448 family)
MRTPPNERLNSDIAESGGTRDPGREETRARSAARTPERRCILTGNVQPRDPLIRLAISPDGDVLPDPLARAPGRGAWIGVNRPALQAAMDKGSLRGALARAFKGAPLNVPADLAQRIEDALVRASLDRLGLEMRGGMLILGAERIAEQARSGRVAALYHASDAREDGRRKLDQAWRVGEDAEGSGLRGIVLPLDRAALSMALGRDNVVHLALADARSAERVAIPLLRLTHFLGAGNPADTA